MEVAYQDEARALAQRVEIRPGLPVGFFEIEPGALLLDDENDGPEQVDVAREVVQLRDVLFVVGNLTTAFPEDLKELAVEALRLAGNALLQAGSGAQPRTAVLTTVT